MKPALLAVVEKLRAGKRPTVLEYGYLLREAGFDQIEARGLYSAYARSMRASPEDEFAALMSSLRSFSVKEG